MGERLAQEIGDIQERFFERIGVRVLNSCEEAGNMVLLLVQSIRDSRFAGSHPRRLFVQMKRVGNDTLFIAAAIALFIGMVLAFHSGYTLRSFQYTEALATIVGLSVVKEMGPVITGLLLAGRIGGSIAAEIGTMQVNEEIDALHTLGISPIRYLAMPRFLACVVMMPILTIYASMAGIVGGAIVASAYFQMSYYQYFKRAFEAMVFDDVAEGLIKALIFGAIVAIVAIHRGLSTRGGAEGVGNAITRCVVTSFMSIIVADYFVTRFML